MALFEVRHVIVIDDDTKQFLRELLQPSNTTVGILEEIRRSREALTTLIMEVQTKMASREELQAGIQQLVTKTGKLGEDLADYVRKIQEQIAAGQDFSNELNLVSQVATRLQSMDDILPERLVPSDSGGTPPTPPDSGGTPPSGGPGGGEDSSGGTPPSGGESSQGNSTTELPSPPQ